MPLINCPECDDKISDKASACHRCGYPIKKLNEEQLQTERLIFKSSDVIVTSKQISTIGRKININGVISVEIKDDKSGMEIFLTSSFIGFICCWPLMIIAPLVGIVSYINNKTKVEVITSGGKCLIFYGEKIQAQKIHNAIEEALKNRS